MNLPSLLYVTAPYCNGIWRRRTGDESGEPIHGYMRELGDPVTTQPTAREYHLLMAGEPTALTATYGLLP